MKILILKSLTTHEKHIDFSKISLEEQMWHIAKETEELDNSVSYLATHDTQENREDVAQEDLDVIQTCIQQLRILESQGVDLEKAVDEHNKKLLEKRSGVIEEVIEAKPKSKFLDKGDFKVDCEAMDCIFWGEEHECTANKIEIDCSGTCWTMGVDEE